MVCLIEEPKGGLIIKIGGTEMTLFTTTCPVQIDGLAPTRKQFE